MTTQPEEALASGSVGEAIRLLMERERDWTGTASELLAALSELVGESKARQKEWPKNGRGLSGQLKRIAPNLRAAGVEVAAQVTHAGRMVSLRRTAQESLSGR